MDSQMTDPQIPDPADAEQQRAVSLLRSVDVAAPDALRARLEAMIDEAGGRRHRRPLSARWRNTLFVPAATALAIVIVALVVAVRIGLRRAERRSDRTACGRPRRQRRPRPRDAARPDLLAAGVDGIPFPSYVSSPGWRATGSRTQVVHHRKIVTIYYRAPDGTRVGYSIVPGHYLSPQSHVEHRPRRRPLLVRTGRPGPIRDLEPRRPHVRDRGHDRAQLDVAEARARGRGHRRLTTYAGCAVPTRPPWRLLIARSADQRLRRPYRHPQGRDRARERDLLQRPAGSALGGVAGRRRGERQSCSPRTSTRSCRSSPRRPGSSRRCRDPQQRQATLEPLRRRGRRVGR